MKKAKKIIVMSLATTMLLGSTLTAHAATPQYKPLSEYGYTGVPKITVKLPDNCQTGVSNAVEDAVKDLDIKLLNTTTITRATYIHSNVFYSKSRVNIQWDAVDGATSYEIKITKADGTEHIYTTENNWLTVNQASDEFVTGCLKQKVGTNWESATVAVRAVKDNGSIYSLWSEKAAISCNAIH